MTIAVAGFRRTGRFEGELKAAAPGVQAAAADALKLLQANPKSKVLRLHQLKQFGKPAVWKIDVFSNHAWQITFELEAGNIVKLCRLAPHKKIDRDPRAD
jgi:hypothetical protein